MSKLFAKHRSKLRSQKQRPEKRQKTLEGAVHDSLNESSASVTDNSESISSQDKFENNSARGIELGITGLSHDGRGISRHKGKMQFVENALPGERVKVELITHKAKFDEVRAVSILHSSEDRVIPKCKDYGKCGGCSLQHQQFDAQLSHKQSVLIELLSKQGLNPDIISPPLYADDYFYRSRTRIACDMRKGKNLFGFRERASQNILEIDECVALAESISQVSSFKSLVTNLSDVSAIGHVELLDHKGHAVVLLRLVKDLSDKDLSMIEKLASAKSLEVFIQRKGEEHAQKAWPKEVVSLLSYDLTVDLPSSAEPKKSLKINYHPSDFTQVNRKVNQLMVSKVIELLQLESNQRVLDLFCGLGNFTLPIACLSAHVVGVEGSDDMVLRAKQNADLNQLSNLSFFKSNLFDVIDHQSWAQSRYDSVVLDPPRAGAKELVKNIGRFGAKRIVYISCNPATLARDSLEICKQGYHLKLAGILDMFPQTSHLESIAVFER